jgi:hypothetical protein
VLHKAPAMPQTRIIDALDTLPHEQVGALASGLEALVSAMGADAVPAAMFFEEAAPKRTGGREGAKPRRATKQSSGSRRTTEGSSDA